MNNAELAGRLETPESPRIIDVRSGAEYRHGHIPGALHVSLFWLGLRLGRMPSDRAAHYVLVCEHGPRAQLAQTLLERRGYTRTELLEGHMHAWKKRGLPLERGSAGEGR